MQRSDYRTTRRGFLELAILGLGTSIVGCGDPEDPISEDNNPINLSKNTPETIITDASNNEVAAAKETQANGLQVIDNLGIRVGNKIFDVVVDQEKLKDLIRLIAGVLLEERYLPEVEILLNKLIISFGSRPFHETLISALNRKNLSAEAPESSWKTKLQILLNRISYLLKEPLGFSVSDADYPFIGVNSGKINDARTFQNVIIHEIGHFVCLANPDLEESDLEGALELTLIHLGLLSTLSVGISSLSLASTTGWDIKRLRSYFALRKELLKSLIFRTAVIEFIPTKLAADIIHYEFFNDDERIANEAVKKTNIDPDEFAKIIRVVERQETR